MDKIPVYLITGFLGSGKTTLIGNFIEYFSNDKKIAIVQNEFAPSNIDGKELKRNINNNFELLEINNGSVFCVCLLSDFITSLSAFTKKYCPDIILIEASGLSDPIAMGQIFESPVLKPELLFSGSICIIDAVNYFKLSKIQQRIDHQIKIADVLIINKTDDLKIIAKNIEEEVIKLNPYAKIYHTNYCQVPVNKLVNHISNPVGISIAKKHPNLKSGGRPDINASVLRTAKPLKNENLSKFLTTISNNSIRIKGYIVTDKNEIYAIQSSYSKYNTEKIDKKNSTQTELIVMSEIINAKSLNQVYKSFC